MSADNRIGKQTLIFNSRPQILSSYAIVGDIEGQGPLAQYFDAIIKDDTLGEKSWEKAESKMLELSVDGALQKADIKKEDVQCMFAGDLLNQIISASYAARELKIPYLGLYGACSTMSESLLMGSILLDGGFASSAVCVTSSHFSTAERQFRAPLEQGSPNTPTSQRTVTGSGCLVLGYESKARTIINVTHATIGKVVDMGIKDASNMGAAMAPAACDTIITHMQDMGRTPNDYDLIVTGDLGQLGAVLLAELCLSRNVDLKGKHYDCGCAIFAPEQNTKSGGSGCGCSAVTLAGYLLKQMVMGTYHRILFMSTGALMSPSATQQGESIPGIAHAIVLERGEGA